MCLAIGTLGPGGAERQATNTLLGLKAYGVSAEALVTFQEHEWQRFFTGTIAAAGVKVDALERAADPIDFLRASDHPDAGRLATAIARTVSPAQYDVALYAREFLRRAPDVVHLWLDEVNVRAGLAAVLVGVPRIVLSTRSLNPTHFPLFQPYMRAGYRVLAACDQVVLLNNSRVGARDYERWIGAPVGACTVLHNGFDFDARLPSNPEVCRRDVRRRLGIPDDAFVVGGVMRFSEEKRPLFWLDTAEIILSRQPDARFLLLGDGVLRDAVFARAAQTPLAGTLLLPGHDTDAYATMCAMDVLFLSSIHEGLPNVLIEAQALGVPVVTTPAGGAAETLDEGRSGWVVHQNTPAAAATIIVDLISDREQLRRACTFGPNFVRSRFGHRRLMEETVAAYGVPPERLGEPSGGTGRRMVGDE